MEWSPAAIDAWESIRNAEGKDYAVWIGAALLALMRHTSPGSALRAALRDRSVWPNPENVIQVRVQETSGFMIYDLPPSAEQAAENERARRVSERHVAMALAERGQSAFNSSGLQVARLVDDAKQQTHEKRVNPTHRLWLQQTPHSPGALPTLAAHGTTTIPP